MDGGPDKDSDILHIRVPVSLINKVREIGELKSGSDDVPAEIVERIEVVAISILKEFVSRYRQEKVIEDNLNLFSS